MPKETFFTAISRWRVVSRRALDASGFWQRLTAVSRPRSSATATMQLYFRRSRAHDLRLAVHDHEFAVLCPITERRHSAHPARAARPLSNGRSP